MLYASVLNSHEGKRPRGLASPVGDIPERMAAPRTPGGGAVRGGLLDGGAR